MFLKGIAGDLNKAWLEIEKTVIRRFEMIHDRPFKFGQIRGVLSSANRFGYNIGEKWFATSMMRNKFMSIEGATHELMHFMFHKYYWDVCIKEDCLKAKMEHQRSFHGSFELRNSGCEISAGLGLSGT